MKRFFTFFFFLTVVSINSFFAQNSLAVINPDWGAWSDDYPGTIEEAEFQIDPKGLYTEVGMFLTFSARGTEMEYYDNLEVIFDFNLPSGSIVHDSWLWMNDTLIVKADILDVSEAREIYEAIVDRNEDPSLLYRKDNGGYQLRIFPMEGMGSRKVKVTYLVPTNWTEDAVESWLPLEFLKYTHNPLASVRIISIADNIWGEPTLSTEEDITFEKITDPEIGELWVTEIPESLFSKSIKFVVDNPMDANGVYVSKLEEANDEKFYQLAYLPPTLPINSEPKNIAILFDHDVHNSHVSKADVFNTVKENLLSTLSEEDQLNLFYSKNGQVEIASPNWVPGDQTSLNQLFSFFTDPIGNWSNLTPGLVETIEFIQQNGGSGEIVLVTNSDNSSNDFSELQPLLSTIEEGEIKIHVINYQTLNYSWSSGWNTAPELYYRHKTLYQNLVNSTGGDFVSCLDHTIDTWEAISNGIKDLKNTSYIFDLNVGLDNGLSYNNFYQTYSGQSRRINQPVLQVGKYVGDFPLTVDFSAYNNGNFSFDTKTIDADEIIEMDTLLREIWTGHLLRAMEGNVSNGSDIEEIVELSIKERVLSRYTAFLALELAQGGEPCLNCWYSELIIATGEELISDFELTMTASPNPFTDLVQLNFELKGNEMPAQLNVQIFDALGNHVRTLNVEELLSAGSAQATWDGKDMNGNKLSTGIYHLVVQTEEEIQTLKLVLIK